ncbi:MAG: tRNA lysidine(34) synthetase TilS [Pseudomonadota bacterium]|jgi:tRNA(Ile)-lysidine synthase
MAASRNKLSNELLNRVGDFVAARTATDEPLALGLSGGCDSLVLLHLLASLGLGQRLSAIHVHHGLSPSADAWADFCTDFCARLDISLDVQSVTVNLKSGQGIEAAARQARYAAFSNCAAPTILLAHHQGDQAETLLFNLLRGAGVAGAAGMADERRHGDIRILRPLLNVPRSALEAYAVANQLSWIEDESNTDTRFTRNFLRHDVLTVISQRFPAAEQNLAQAAGHFSEAAVLLDALAEEDWQMARDVETLNLRRLRPLGAARIKNLLRYRLRQMAWQTPVATRLDEFVRQLLSAAPDRHPELKLDKGLMRIAKGQLSWITQK